MVGVRKRIWNSIEKNYRLLISKLQFFLTRASDLGNFIV